MKVLYKKASKEDIKKMVFDAVVAQVTQITLITLITTLIIILIITLITQVTQEDIVALAKFFENNDNDFDGKIPFSEIISKCNEEDCKFKVFTENLPPKIQNDDTEVEFLEFCLKVITLVVLIALVALGLIIQ